MMVVIGSKLAILLRENLLLPKQPHVKQEETSSNFLDGKKPYDGCNRFKI